MGTVLQFPRRSSLICHEVTQAQADAAQSALFGMMQECVRCSDRGWIFFYRANGIPDVLPCPCGGTDADRIDLGEVS
ncbi:hypothetical protein ACFOYU_11455 [Microvirga sp. GCM10011540]|uniref:hypothetical protein n=1 Tax=Microvirga sp. GCM10011540 TaxID=3317338 RepID=UPI003618B729